MGWHLLRYLTREKFYDLIINASLTEPEDNLDGVHNLVVDVRLQIDTQPFLRLINDNRVVIYHLAAIARIPGHPDKDYFETNILGAENVCAFAEAIDCQNIVFTSSISLYGASEEQKLENTLPQPDNAYGISKLVAEHIVRRWHSAAPGRKLSILRPGIIFGKHENANFTRLYKSMARRYFFYPGRRDTSKACIYVKDVAELCYRFAESDDDLNIFNLCYQQPPTIETICQTISKVTGLSTPRITVPAWILVGAAGLLTAVFRLIGRKNISLHPDRVMKLMISTNISGEKLADMGYHFKYPLYEAIRDWYHDNEEKGLY